MRRSSRRAGKLILIVILVIALIAGAGVGAFVLAPKVARHDDAELDEDEVMALEADEGAERGEGVAATAAGESEKETEGDTRGDQEDKTQVAKSKKAAAAKAKKLKAQKAKKKKKKDEDELASAQVVGLGDFLVNIQDNSGLRYLRAEISLSLLGLQAPRGGGHGDGDKALTLPEGDLAVARDCVVSVLSAANLDQLHQPEGRVVVKKRLQEALNKVLGNYEVDDVLFTSFVMQ